MTRPQQSHRLCAHCGLKAPAGKRRHNYCNEQIAHRKARAAKRAAELPVGTEVGLALSRFYL